MNVEQGAPEGRNLYRRFMSLVRHDNGWVTGPVWSVTVGAPSLAGLAGVIGFSERVVGELTQERPLLLARALAAITPAGLFQGIPSIGEILATGNFKQAGVYALGAIGSAALLGVGAYFGEQARLGLEDAQRADFEEHHRRYTPRNIY